jgi:hypothetical protein
MFARRILPEDMRNKECSWSSFLVTLFLRRIRESQIAKHTREVHKIPSLDKGMWMKIHKAEKLPLLFLFLVSEASRLPFV